MDQWLRAALTAPGVGCTQEQIDAFEREQIVNVSDVQLLSDADFQALRVGIALKNRVRASLPALSSQQQQRAPPVQTTVNNHFAAVAAIDAVAATARARSSAATSSSFGRQGGLKKAKLSNENKQMESGLRGFLRRATPSATGALPNPARRAAPPAPVAMGDDDEQLTLDELVQLEGTSTASPSAAPPTAPPATAAPPATSSAGSASSLRLDVDEDDSLCRIVNMFKPKSKAVLYGASSVTLSAQLRKMIAQTRLNLCRWEQARYSWKGASSQRPERSARQFGRRSSSGRGLMTPICR